MGIWHVKQPHDRHTHMSASSHGFGKKEFKRHFDRIRKDTYRGVPGVWRVDSGVKGPVLGITIHTHGNEPSGLAILAHFSENDRLVRMLKRGSVIFVLNNIKATERYLRARTKDEKKASRFKDVNMNRLPRDLKQRKKDTRYEIRRARELLPIWKLFDAAIDVHSMSQKSKPFIIAIGTLPKKLVHGFPIQTIVSNIQDVMRDRSAITFYGNGRIPSLGVETGSHEQRESFVCGVRCITALLQNMNMTDKSTSFPRKRNYTHYRLYAPLWLHTKDAELARPYRNYERVRKGEVLALDGKRRITATKNGHVILPPVGTKPKHLGEETLFLSEPVKTIRI